MADSLVLKERVRNAIQLGESHFREFKSALEGPPSLKKSRPVRKVCEDVGEALVAFANADGGELLIGVEDDGTISGVPHPEHEVQEMLAASRSHVHPDSALPMTAAVSLVLESRRVLFFSVAKGSTEVYQLPDGRCISRSDKTSAPVTIKRLLFDRQEVRSREYDRLFVDGATVADLDIDLLKTLADQYLQGLSVERFLQQIGLAEYAMSGLRLRMAALLLFAKDIQRWHPRSQVRILKLSGTELLSGDNYNVQSDEPVQGNIIDLLTKAWETLRPFLASRTAFGTDARFEQKYIYPEGACREALVNAIAHRDYTIQNGIDVFVFDDRMEIRSPGALLSTLTIADLETLSGRHESRNALVAKVLRENKIVMRELGEGMKRIFKLMEQSDLGPPTLHSNTRSFSITLMHRSVYTTKQEQWLSLFQQYELTTPQKHIILLGMNDRPISSSDIYKAMNTRDRDKYDREVTALRLSGILVEVRSNTAAVVYARRTNVHKSEVPRFKVRVPDAATGAMPVVRAGLRTVAAVDPDEDADKGIYVANLPPHVTEQDLRQMFSVYGAVSKVVLPTDPGSQQVRGFGFVWFSTPDAAKSAMERFVGTRLGGRRIVVNKYIPKRTRT